MPHSLASEFREARTLLADTWISLPAALKGKTQFLGRQYMGCGATIGVMPKCDLNCIACYLGESSNQSKPLLVEEIKEQILALRKWLGPCGNLQLTDGEVTLRPISELVELIRYARKVGLVPMLMTHGETFRLQPELLERLMTEGGLTEICFHVDTTMRGRRHPYSEINTEKDLNNLRAEFADLIRTVRRRTGLRLEAASTATVTQYNLNDIPEIVHWFLANTDAFKMLSFQPVAEVGKTLPSQEGVSPDNLWSRIAEGAGNMSLLRGEGWLGHPSCGRFVQGLAVKRKNRMTLEPMYRSNNTSEIDFLNRLLDRAGGISFRLYSRNRTFHRIIYFLRYHFFFILRHGLPYTWQLLKRVGTFRARYFCIVSHHFMNEGEIDSKLGIERQSACVFRVPVKGRLEPMCVVNACGMRDRVYKLAGKTVPKETIS